MDATFAALMNKAKANTQTQSGLVAAKQAELQAAREREARIEKEIAAREQEKRLRELEARQRREKERLAFEEKLRLEREKKRAERQDEDDSDSKRAKVRTTATTATKAKSTTQPLASARATKEIPAISSIARKKKRQIDAMFSDDDMSSDASAARRHHKANAQRKMGTGSTSGRSVSNANLSAKARLRAEFDPGQLRSLNENKRDVRTIEEIENDLHRKQKEAKAEKDPSTISNTGMFAARKTAGTSSKTTTTVAAAAAASNSKSQLPPVASTSSLPPKAIPRPTKAEETIPAAKPVKNVKDRSPADGVAASKVRTAAKPSARRSRSDSDSSPPPASRDKVSKAQARRAEIWAILNPHKVYKADHERISEDEISDDDMEAGIDDIEEEDREAARIALLEDKREEMRIQQRAKEKAEKKKGKI